MDLHVSIDYDVFTDWFFALYLPVCCRHVLVFTLANMVDMLPAMPSGGGLQRISIAFLFVSMAKFYLIEDNGEGYA
jgi:hypothetical protein